MVQVLEVKSSFHNINGGRMRGARTGAPFLVHRFWRTIFGASTELENPDERRPIKLFDKVEIDAGEGYPAFIQTLHEFSVEINPVKSARKPRLTRLLSSP